MLHLERILVGVGWGFLEDVFLFEQCFKGVGDFMGMSGHVHLS